MRQYYAGEGSELPGRVNIGIALTHACVESNLPKAPILQPPASVKDVISRMLRRAVQRYWRTFEILSDFQLLLVSTLRNQARGKLTEHMLPIVDCMAQLPKFLQNEDRVQRNEAFAGWTTKRQKTYIHGVAKGVSRSSLSEAQLEQAKTDATEDVGILANICKGLDVEFETRSDYERLSSAIAKHDIQLQAVVTTAIKRVPKEDQIAHVSSFTGNDHGGYDDESVKKLVLDGLQFNSQFGCVLPPQFVSVVRKRAFYRLEQKMAIFLIK